MTSPTPNAPQWVQAPDGSWQQAVPIPPAPPKPKKPSELPKMLGGLMLCLVGGFVVVMIGAAASSTKTPAATPAVAAPSGETLAGWAGRTKHYSDDLGAASGAIGAAATSNDTPAMVVGCQDLKVTATAWRAELPSPDPGFDSLIRPALDNYVLAADKCISAGATLSVADLQESGAAIESATSSIRSATAYLAAHN